MFAFLGTLFSAVLGFFAQWFTRRTAVALGIVAGVVSVTGVLFLVFQSAISSVSVVMPSYVRTGLDMVIPSNFVPCISAIFGLRISVWLWQWKVHFIEMYAGNS